jgi:hypothetical protein
MRLACESWGDSVTMGGTQFVFAARRESTGPNIWQIDVYWDSNRVFDRLTIIEDKYTDIGPSR